LAIGEDGEILVADTGNRRIQRVELVNKDKTVALAPNPATKLLVSGPAVSLDWPARALAAADGRLCGWLAKARVFRCVGPGGKGERSFGHGGEGLSQTRQAGGLAFSGKLGFVASDTPADRLQVFSAAGAWQTNIAEASGFFDSKKKEGRVRQPLGVAINDEGTIYVADAGNHRVDAFDFNGNFLFAIGPKLGPLELQRPVAVAWDKARFLYIADQGLQKIVKTEPSGGYLASWGQSGKGAGQLLKPSALAFDGRSYLYLLDAGNKRVSIFDTDGHWQTDLFGRGRRDQALEEPSALAVQGDTLYVSDLASGKTKGFSLHVRLAAPDGLALAAKDGAVRLSWKPVDNPWLEGYEVLRSSEAAGPFMELARPAAAHFEDAQAAAQATYWYRVAALSASGDLGVASAASQIVVPASVNKSPVELSTVTIGDIFSADYKWYLGNAVGSAVVVNNVHAPFENVKLTFRLKDFMDFGYDTVIKTLAPEAAVRVPLMATLNNKILEVSEDTPIQAQLTLTYFENGQERQVSLAKPLRVYSRNAIRWDDPRRVAAFITPMDPPIVEFARAAESVAASSAPLNANVLTALRLWDSLSDYGVGFFANPDNPYEKLSEDPNFPVDYTQFPRETLKRKSGQCDDLTTLLISLLGASDVRAVVADYPGHMALMFDTGADEVEDVGLPPDQ
ncbi:MAG: NHL repeat-containing protein, partial [Elusimicrobia bacterium]|nr:NHL repeat-containing protein [Elusimicrobiota bacterium]